jgi:hypothetical protein
MYVLLLEVLRCLIVYKNPINIHINKIVAYIYIYIYIYMLKKFSRHVLAVW